MIKRIVILMLAVGVSLLIGEMVIRLWFPQRLSGSWRVLTDKGLLVNRSEGVARHESGARAVCYAFSPPHLRGPGPDTNACQILVLGDSFTFGWLLPEDKHFVHILQELADAQFGPGSMRFLNAGTAGWGTAHYTAFVEDFGDAISPDVVLVVLNLDDIGRSITSGLYQLSDRSPDGLERIIRSGSATKRWANRLPGYPLLLEHSHLAQLIRRTWLKGWRLPSRHPAPTDSAEAVRLGQRLFLRLHRWCSERDIPLWVITTGWHDPVGREISNDPTRAFMAQAESFFGKAGIPFFDVSPVFFNIPETRRTCFIIPHDGHPSEEGSTWIARENWNRFLSDALSNHVKKGPPSKAKPRAASQS